MVIKLYYCHHCKEAFIEKFHFHIFSIMSETFNCVLCKKTFHTNKGLKIHTTLVHKKM